MMFQTSCPRSAPGQSLLLFQQASNMLLVSLSELAGGGVSSLFTITVYNLFAVYSFSADCHAGCNEAAVLDVPSL